MLDWIAFATIEGQSLGLGSKGRHGLDREPDAIGAFRV